MTKRNTIEVYAKAFSVCLATFLVTELVEGRTSRVQAFPLRWAYAFTAVQGVTMLFMGLYLVIQRGFAQWREARYDRIRPAVREQVLSMAFEGAAGTDRLLDNRQSRRVLEESVIAALSTLKSTGRDRIGRFAMEQGFATAWLKSFSSRSSRVRRRAISLLGLISPVAGATVLPIALHDRDLAVRTEACRALLIFGERAGVDQVFRLAVRESLLTRALLTDDLRPFAAILLADTVPTLLQTGSFEEIRNCFQILTSWNRALPQLDLGPWLADTDTRWTRELLALIPFVAIESEGEEFLHVALHSTDRAIQCAALQTVGQVGSAAFLPSLQLLLGDDKLLSWHAAQAIAHCGAEGKSLLEHTVTTGSRAGAGVALEALERLSMGTLGFS